MNDDDEKIVTTKDKLKLTLKEQKEIKSSPTMFFTYIGFIFALGIPILTSTFNDFIGIKGEYIKCFFVFLVFFFFILTIRESVKIVRNKIKGVGDEEWFLCKVQGKEVPKKEKISFSFSDIDFKWILKIIIMIILYVLPLGLWILVISLIGWPNAWNNVVETEGQVPTWFPTLFFSIIWLGGTYFALIAYSSDINDFFDEALDIY